MFILLIYRGIILAAIIFKNVLRNIVLYLKIFYPTGTAAIFELEKRQKKVPFTVCSAKGTEI